MQKWLNRPLLEESHNMRIKEIKIYSVMENNLELFLFTFIYNFKKGMMFQRL